MEPFEMNSISYIDSYKAKVKTNQLSAQIQTQPLKETVEQASYTKNDIRKRWGLTALLTTFAMIGLSFIGKEAKNVALKRKLGLGILAGASVGSAVHFLFTKKSKLKEDNLTNNFGKRLGIMAGIGAINTVVSLRSIKFSKIKLFRKVVVPVKTAADKHLKGVIGKGIKNQANSLLKDAIKTYKAKIGFYTGVGMVSMGALLYTGAEAIKGITDKSLKEDS